MNKYRYLLILLGSFFLLASCSKSVNLKKANRLISHSELILNNSRLDLDFHNISIKYSAILKVGITENELVGNIRIHKDSIIWGNLNLGLGIELARFLFEKEKFAVINKKEKVAYSGMYCSPSIVENADIIKFDDLYNLLLGQSITRLKDSLLYSDNVVSSEYVDRYAIHQHMQDYCTCIVFDSETYKIREFSLSKKNTPISFSVKYDKFLQINNKLVPTSLVFTMSDGDDSRSITINYTKVKVNSEFKTPFTIPRNFKTIEL